MIRVGLAAIVVCSTLWGALGRIDAEPFAAQHFTSAAVAPAPHGCTPDDDGEWRPQHDAAAFLTESPWKTRILHAGLRAAADPGAIVASVSIGPPPARAPAAPSYLLHTPLLI